MPSLSAPPTSPSPERVSAFASGGLPDHRREKLLSWRVDLAGMASQCIDAQGESRSAAVGKGSTSHRDRNAPGRETSRDGDGTLRHRHLGNRILLPPEVHRDRRRIEEIAEAGRQAGEGPSKEGLRGQGLPHQSQLQEGRGVQVLPEPPGRARRSRHGHHQPSGRVGAGCPAAVRGEGREGGGDLQRGLLGSGRRRHGAAGAGPRSGEGEQHPDPGAQQSGCDQRGELRHGFLRLHRRSRAGHPRHTGLRLTERRLRGDDVRAGHRGRGGIQLLHERGKRGGGRVLGFRRISARHTGDPGDRRVPRGRQGRAASFAGWRRRRSGCKSRS